jgi:PhnB protein
MPKPNLSEQLDHAIQALLTSGPAVRRRDGATPNAPSAALARIASELRGLPRADFKATLRAKLEGRTLMASKAAAAPEVPQTATAYLTVKGAARAIEFYKQAFGAVEMMRLNGPGDRIGHAQIRIGNTTIMLADEFPDYGALSAQTIGGSPVRIHLQVDDVDAMAARAIAAGAKVLRPVQDQFYGERTGQFADPFGLTWVIATHKETLTTEEMQRRFENLAENAPAPPAKSNKSGTRASYMPEGYRTITPYLTVADAPQLINFVKQTFGAEESFRTTGAAGGIHCELRVGNTMLMVGGGAGQGSSWSGTPSPSSLHIYVPDCDAAYQRALRANATSVSEPADQPWGERMARVKDPSGNNWFIAFPSYLEKAKYEVDDVQTLQAVLHPTKADPVIEFLKRAFGAEDLGRALSPEGLLLHTTIQIGDSTLEMSDAVGPYQPAPTTFYLYVADADGLYRRALDAGATSIKAPADQSYGDRMAAVKDLAGNQWYLATYLGDSKPDAKSDLQSAPKSDAPATAAKDSTASVNYIRAGFHTLTPYLLVTRAAKLIEFLKAGFGAHEIFRVNRPPDNSVMHAELRLGDSTLELSDGNEEFPPRAVWNIFYVEDVDGVYASAIRAGATAIRSPADQPWGDRTGVLRDPSGNVWEVTTHHDSAHITPDTRSIVPGFNPASATQFIEFAKQAFDAEEAFMLKMPDGKVAHARIRVGDSILAVVEGSGQMQPMPFHLHLYVPDTDAVYQKALRAGAKPMRTPRNEPYGDRAATVADTFGNLWSIATHIKDVQF